MVIKMIFSFKVNSPGDIIATLENLQKKLAQHKGKFNGDEKGGFISSNGIDGQYIVKENTIEITVLKKPLLIPNKVIEKEIKKIFTEVSVQ